VVRVTITPKGKQLVEDTMQPLKEMEDRILQKLSEADKSRLLQLLNLTRESISHVDD
jgi:DNA-binding MarR family transcriptional regulator